jgi:hypothetical protein
MQIFFEHVKGQCIGNQFKDLGVSRKFSHRISHITPEMKAKPFLV